jgi:hypothetical protein
MLSNFSFPSTGLVETVGFARRTKGAGGGAGSSPVPRCKHQRLTCLRATATAAASCAWLGIRWAIL